MSNEAADATVCVPHAIVDTESTGRALTTTAAVARGAVVWRYAPLPYLRRLTYTEIQNLPAGERETFETYCWQLDWHTWEGVTDPSNYDPVNYLNHSCEPNLTWQDDCVLVATRDIARGETLTIDYATADSLYAPVGSCECGTAACRGRITCTEAYVTTRPARSFARQMVIEVDGALVYPPTSIALGGRTTTVRVWNTDVTCSVRGHTWNGTQNECYQIRCHMLDISHRETAGVFHVTLTARD